MKEQMVGGRSLDRNESFLFRTKLGSPTSGGLRGYKSRVTHGQINFSPSPARRAPAERSPTLFIPLVLPLPGRMTHNLRGNGALAALIKNRRADRAAVARLDGR